MTVPAPTPRLDAETSAYLAEMGAQLAQLTDEDEVALLAATALAEASRAAIRSVRLMLMNTERCFVVGTSAHVLRGTGCVS